MERGKYYHLLDRESAIQLVRERWNPGVREVPLIDALGMISAEQVVASFDVPPHSRSTVDGYAVIASDTYPVSDITSVFLDVVGEVKMGEFPSTVITHGKTLRIETGGFLPEGADAVVPREYAVELENGKVEIHYKLAPGQNVTMRGWDIKKGEIILNVGDRIDPLRIGVLAAEGIHVVKVYDNRILLHSVGNELVAPGTARIPGQIYDINSFTLINLMRLAGVTGNFGGILPDDPESVRKVIETSQESVVMFSGGTSKGLRDPVTMVLEELEEETSLYIRGLSMKPGKPTNIALLRDKLILALPGNPTSAIMSFLNVCVPILSKVGARYPLKSREAVLSTRVWGADGRETFQAVRISNEMVSPVNGGSEEISTLAKAHGFIIIPKNTRYIEKGEKVIVHCWERE